ncbi:MAG: hypothetical protein IPP71_07075 [Bacteroidetes bacterium]|nr:hypothetical protein [Bacteroidota bacterium]
MSLGQTDTLEQNTIEWIKSRTSEIIKRLNEKGSLDHYAHYSNINVEYEFTTKGGTHVNEGSNKIYIDVEQIASKLKSLSMHESEPQLYYILSHEMAHIIQYT